VLADLKRLLPDIIIHVAAAAAEQAALINRRADCCLHDLRIFGSLILSL
jgi:hypothetical protein